jgi:anaphase-promoting complex subunit 2
MSTDDNDDGDKELRQLTDSSSESSLAMQEQIKMKSDSILTSLVKLHMLSFYENLIMKAFRDVIDRQTLQYLHQGYDSTYLPSCKSWFDNMLLSSLATIFSTDSIDKQKLRTKTLWNYVTNAIFKIRTKELFEIIQDFPSSHAAIIELKTTSANNLSQVGKMFRKVIQNRLLHPGASTTQILDIYILMIRSFRLLDPSDSILNYVAAPIRAYLKQRKDTVHRIVSSLSEGRDSDLQMELKKGESLEDGQDEDFEEPVCVENWQPRKRHPELQDTGFSGLDILALLVSIYGSTDVFVKEYRTQLGSKLLANQNYSIDEDMATLEHLKKRYYNVNNILSSFLLLRLLC